jgi:uncharacterized protein YbjT (DUF2867 family)
MFMLERKYPSSWTPLIFALLLVLAMRCLIAATPLGHSVPASPVLLITSADGPEGLPLTQAILRGGRQHVVAGVDDVRSDAAVQLEALGASIRTLSKPAKSADFAGVDCVLILAPLTQDREEQGRAQIVAAAAEVDTALLLSVSGANETGAPASLHAYRALELQLGRTWPTSSYAVLRTLFYQQNLELWAADVRASGVLRLPLYGRTFAPLHQHDVAAVTVSLTATARLEARFERRALELTGPELVSGGSLATKLSAAVGTPIRFANASRAQAEQTLLSNPALDESEATLLLDLLDWQSRIVSRPSGDVKAATGMDATPVETFFNEASDEFRNHTHRLPARSR